MYRSVFDGGHWSQLNSSEHSLYIVMRTFSFFDGELFSEIEDTEFGHDVNGLIKVGLYQDRKYDFVYAEINILAEHAGISKSAVYSAIKILERKSLIEETYSLDGRATFKIFRIPEWSYTRRWLNDIVEKEDVKIFV